MGGGLMQLVAYGAQDVYLTGNPQITYFKVVYRRHTNFATEVVELTLGGNPDFGRRSTVVITRNGDLITKMYLRVNLPQVFSKDGSGSFGWVRRIGHAMINNVDIEIGGSRIDRHYGTWLDIWYELTHQVAIERGYNIMIGDVPALTNMDYPDPTTSMVKDQYLMFVPLQFWFNRNTGLALPLIALQYHEVRLDIEFYPVQKMYCSSTDFSPQPISLQDCSLLVDYVYLDAEERRRFAQVGHEYLIEQLQFTGTESANQKSLRIRLGFNHPCKELVWAIRNGNFNPISGNGNAFLAYTNNDAAWGTDAVQAAADNIANNLVILYHPTATAASNPLATFPDSVGNDYRVVNPVPTTGLDVDGSYVFDFGGTGPTITVDLSIVGFVPPGTPATGQQSEYQAVYLRNNAFVIGSYDIATQLQDISVTVTFDPTQTDDARWSFTASAVAHTFNVHDLSIPVNLWTDNRTQTSSGSNPYDIIVFQWHNYGCYLDGTVNPVDQALIQLNGHDRFDIREGQYFNYVQPYQCHTRTPADGVNVYSFALHPEQHQPSGTANLSRIDTTQLNLSLISPLLFPNSPPLQNLNQDSQLWNFAVNYNVLRIMSGMGGLAYSN